MNKILLIIGLLYLVFCGSKKVEIIYYDNGHIKYKKELLECGGCKVLYYYYENGQLRKTSEWKNGQLEGIIREYRKGGQLESISYWREGEQNGEAKHYYESGQLQTQIIYKNDIKIGEAIYYRRDGTLDGKDYYNEEGRIIDFKRYKEDGTWDKMSIAPIYYTEKDTISIGEEIKYEVRIGNRVYDHVTAMIGEPDQENLSWLKDTTAIFDEDNYVLTHTIKPTKPGADSIKGRIYNFNNLNDTIYRFGFTFTYYVENTL